MTDHPCKGMPHSCRRDFELIAIGKHPWAEKTSVPKLVQAGMIEEIAAKTHRDRFGTFTIRQFRVLPEPYEQWVDYECERQEQHVVSVA